MRAGDDLRLVGGVGGRDVLGVVDGGLRVLEQRLARVGARELVDLVLVHHPHHGVVVGGADLAAAPRPRHHLLGLARLERVGAVERALLLVVVVLLAEHRQRVRRDDLHRAARVRERGALGRALGRAEQRALLRHRRVVQHVRAAVGVARDDLVEARVPQQRHDARAVDVDARRDLVRRAVDVAEDELRPLARALAHRRPRHQQRAVGREVAARHREQRRQVGPRRERRVEAAHVPQLERAVGRAAREAVAVAVPPHARDVGAVGRVRAARHAERPHLLGPVLPARRRVGLEDDRLVLGRAELPQLQRAVAAAAHDRLPLGVPRHRRAARLDAARVLEHRDRPLPAVDVERHGVVAALDGHLDVPQPHRAVLARRAHEVAVVHVPRRRRARRDVPLGRAHVADVHVALHERRELAPVAVEEARLVGGARHDDPVARRAVADRAQLEGAERLLEVSEGAQLLRHPRKVPKVEVVVGRARHEPAARRVEREARHRLAVPLERHLVRDRHLHRPLRVVVVVVARAEDLLAHVGRVVVARPRLVDVAGRRRVEAGRQRRAHHRLLLLCGGGARGCGSGAATADPGRHRRAHDVVVVVVVVVVAIGGGRRRRGGSGGLPRLNGADRRRRRRRRRRLDRRRRRGGQARADVGRHLDRLLALGHDLDGGRAGVRGVRLLEALRLDLLPAAKADGQVRAHLVVVVERRRRDAARGLRRRLVAVVVVVGALLLALLLGRLRRLRRAHRRHHGRHHVGRHQLALVLAERDLERVK